MRKHVNIQRKLNKAFIDLIRYGLLIGISFTILFPLLTKIPSALMTTTDLLDPTVRWVPRFFTLENFRIAFEHMEYPRSFLITVGVSFLIAFLQLICCTLAGYGLARFKFPGNNFLFGLVLFTLLVPPQTILVPQYLNFRFFDLMGLIPDGGWNLVGTYWPIILMAATGIGLRGGLLIFIARQTFRGMSRSLQEAAYLDGAGPFRTFYSVMLPNAVSALVIIFIFSYVWQWNEYYFSSLLLEGTDMLAIRLERLQNAIGLAHGGIPFEQQTLILNAGMFLFIFPLLVLYGFLQRFFLESVERTNIISK